MSHLTSLLVLAIGFCHSLSQGIHLSLRGLDYSNNSVVNLDNIGNSSSRGLVCHTSYINCCARDGPDYLGSRWYYPGNRTVTSNRSSTEPFTRSRGTMSISLHHRANAEEDPPVGIYYCEIRIRTTQIILQEIYVGLYSINKGQPSTSSITYNPATRALTCVSSGGPASEVTWSRSGPQYQEHQQIVNTTTATYLNILTINSSELTDHTGTFTCTVSNTRGMDTVYTTVEGIGIFGSKSVYKLKSKVSVTCYSHLKVLSLTWRDAITNELVSSISNQQSLLLHYESLTLQMNKSRYICQAIILLPGDKAVKTSKDFTILISENTSPPAVLGEILEIGVPLAFCVIIVIAIAIALLAVVKRNKLRPAPAAGASLEDHPKSKEKEDNMDELAYDYIDHSMLRGIHNKYEMSFALKSANKGSSEAGWDPNKIDTHNNLSYVSVRS